MDNGTLQISHAWVRRDRDNNNNNNSDGLGIVTDK